MQEQRQIQANTFEALTLEHNRVKMKLQLREDKINKLEADLQDSGNVQEVNDECVNLQIELRLLHEQLKKEQEEVTNPKILNIKS